MGNSNTTKVAPDFSPGGPKEPSAALPKQPRTVARERTCCLPCFDGAWPRRNVRVAGPNAPAVVVVDPYSSGRFLLYELAPKYQIICVRSSVDLGPRFMKAYNSHKQYFAETIDFESIPQVLACLEASQCNKVVAVFAGCEPGVELADKLAEALKLAGNDTKLTKARKNKAAMQDRLRECGLPAAEQTKSADLDDLVQWAMARNQWPLVAKPTGSSGSDGIFFCKDVEDIKAAHSEVIGKRNPSGKVNAEIVLQEFLAGTEYIVDTVSHAGEHLVCAIWVYTKRKGTPWNPNCIISEGNKMLEASGEVQDVLVSYVFNVLDAVGLQYGPCHTEVMLTPRGPILVEVNARLHGLQGPHLIGLATGTSKATYAVDAFAEGGQLIHTRIQQSKGMGRFLYPLEKSCLQMVLISPVQGYLAKPIDEAVKELKLSSVVEVVPNAQKGGYLKQSCDLHTAAGYVLMVHESAAQVEADRLCIRKAEESGLLYKVSQNPIPGSPVPSPKSPGSIRPSPASPRLQSVEVVEQAWDAEDGFTLDGDGDVEMNMVEG